MLNRCSVDRTHPEYPQGGWNDGDRHEPFCGWAAEQLPFPDGCHGTCRPLRRFLHSGIIREHLRQDPGPGGQAQPRPGQKDLPGRLRRPLQIRSDPQKVCALPSGCRPFLPYRKLRPLYDKTLRGMRTLRQGNMDAGAAALRRGSLAVQALFYLYSRYTRSSPIPPPYLVRKIIDGIISIHI